jgi:hydroxymethylglutaryl-CoA lyase/(R)-citramalyl-CoA lyase
VPITLCDVGPRDGLQNDPVALAPAVRTELSRRIAAAGVPRVEVASFVNPRLVPAMAGAEEVVAGLAADAGTVWAGLVLNERGLERALATAVTEVHVAYPVTPGFARANQNTTPDEAAAATARIIAAAHAGAVRATVTLSCAYGCPFDGRVDAAVVQDHVERAFAAGADEVVLADTIGVGTPPRTRQMVTAALGAGAGRAVGVHLHNTRNTGYANAFAAVDAGATVLDAAIGGLGGCPFAPNATGNVATEDLVYLLEESGHDTGVDLDALVRTSAWLAGVLGHDLPGLVHRAGPFPAARA